MLMSTTSVAKHLGLTRRRVTELVRTGVIGAEQVDSGHWLIESQAVARYRLTVPVNGRPWNPGVAWDVIEALTVGGRATERTGDRIRENSAEKIAAQISRLIRVERYEARSLNQNLGILKTTAESAVEAIGLNLAGASPVMQAYVTVENWESLLDAVSYTEGNLEVHSWRDGENRGDSRTPLVLIAIDCTRSTNARVRAAGITYLGGQREKWLAKNTM